MSEKFQFIVDRHHHMALVAMDLGGVIRARHMPVSMLEALSHLCERIRAEVIDLVTDISEFPLYPKCHGLARATLGSVDVRVSASLHNNRAEYMVAFYDDDDPDCPALLLIDDQIEEFIERVNEALNVPNQLV